MELTISVLLGISVILAYVVYALIYNLYLSPLSKIPAAHPLARFTDWWMTFIRWSQKETRTIHRAHALHGPVVLLGPSEVSVNCIKGGLSTVYSGGFEKGDWYDIFTNYGGVRNMFALPWSKAHAARKRMLSNIYSKTFLQSSSALREMTGEIVGGRLLPRLELLERSKEAFDVYSELSGMTMDFVTGYIFGLRASSNFILDAPRREKFLGWYTSRIGFNFWPQECPRLTAFLERLGIQMVPDHVGQANAEIEKWCLDMCDAATTFLQEKAVAKADDLQEGERRDYPMVFGQLAGAMEKSKESSVFSVEQKRLELASEMLDHLAAGFDTSGITLCYFVHEISQRPDVQEKLRAELLTLDPPVSPEHVCSGPSPTLPAPKQLDALPYLDACLHETLRLRAAIPGPEPRITPQSGCVLGPNGEYPNIPGGLRISALAHSLHRNAAVYPQPEAWRPERWLESSEEQLREMRRWFWAFGSGGRMCVGSNLALYQMKFIIAAIYTRWRTVVVDDAGIAQLDLYTAPPGGGKLVVSLERA